MSFSFETFAWAVSALFQLLAVCAYLLSFPHVDGVCDQLPDIDGVDDQLPDMPEVIQDSAIEMKITYSGIIFVFGFYTQVVVVWVSEASLSGDNPAVAAVLARTP